MTKLDSFVSMVRLFCLMSIHWHIGTRITSIRFVVGLHSVIFCFYCGDANDDPANFGTKW